MKQFFAWCILMPLGISGIIFMANSYVPRTNFEEAFFLGIVDRFYATIGVGIPFWLWWKWKD